MNTPATVAAVDAPRRRLAAERDFLGYLGKLRRLESVAEFGCGLATWLRVAREMGVTDVHGYDVADMPLAARGLVKREFTGANLANPLKIARKFDLAVCLELAQQLPPQAAAVLIRTLCSAADWVLFSAAIPFQGGSNHANENWMEYWARLFMANDFLCFDILREKFWHAHEIPFYLRQNACLYVRAGANESLAAQGIEPTALPASLIHPELYLKALAWLSNREGEATDSRMFAADLASLYQGQVMTGAPT